jgi:type IV secretion system protein VirD4
MVVAFAGTILLAAIVLWAGALLSSAVVGHPTVLGLDDAVRAGVRLPSHLTKPADAWRPAGAHLPGPLIYWPSTGLAGAAAAAIVLLGYRLLHRRVGTARRRAVGVDARARFARRSDLRSLLIRQPVPGRFILGRRGHLLVATETPTHRRRRRSGDRGAVALIGPSRSGKTTAAVGGILDWDGPAVLSSVKADLLGTTYAWRKEQGQVLVYDPTGSTGHSTASWSPLRDAASSLGAQRAARALCDAAPRDDNVEGGLDFWLTQSEILLSGLLWVAAQSDRDMAAVCEWVMVQDSPSEAGPGEVKACLDRLLTSQDADVRDGAVVAGRSLLSVWRMEERTRSSVYATAQSVTWPWADPGVAAAARETTISLDWLLSGRNTTYLCAPIEDQRRLSPAFGGLLNDLIRQVYLRVARTNRPLDPPLLVVIDEAGNTPLRALPEYASTLAGLGVLLVTIWQSLAQIEAAYRGHSDTIITNHLSKVFYGGLSDPIALRYLSQVLGDVEVDTSSRTSSIGPDSVQLSTTHLPLVPPHAARQMRSGGSLLIHGSLPPAHIRTRAWWSDRHLADRVPRSLPGGRAAVVEED